MKFSSSMEIFHQGEDVSTETHDGSLLLADEKKMAEIVQPHHHDVLCGRGVTTNRHAGNESFRRLVGLNKEVYVSSTKKEKMAISRSIVGAIRSLDPPGRFLDKDPVTGLWFDIGHKKAIEKTSQALRDGAAVLRRQLSADLGDPGFLNNVFAEGGENDIKPTTENDKTSDGSETSSDKAVQPDQPLSCKKPTEKLKPVKKTKPPVSKKSHRRTLSNPSTGAASIKHHRRPIPTEPPPSPIVRYTERHSQVSPSPRTPCPNHSVSQPSTPATWGETSTYFEGESPASLRPVPSYSYFDHQPHSPSSSSPYSRDHGYYRRSYPYEYSDGSPSEGPYHERSYSHDYHHDSPPGSRSTHADTGSWSSQYERPIYSERSPAGIASHYSWHSSPGHPHHSVYSPHPPRPPRSSSPTPVSPPKGPLPPGRHQFSPAGYRAHQPAAEWSSTDKSSFHHNRDSPHSPGYHYEKGFAPSDQSPRWRSPHPHEYYGNHSPAGYWSSSPSRVPHYESSGLAVPSLASESRYHSRPATSSRVMLPPRSSLHGEIPPRPPTSSSRDFAPPPPGPRFRCIRRRQQTSPSWERERSCPENAMDEEKKLEHDADDCSHEENRVPYPSIVNSAAQPTLKLSPAKTSSSPRCVDGANREQGDQVVRALDEERMQQHTHCQTASNPRASPLSARIDVLAQSTDAPTRIEDIAMSPISMDREDPGSLMELPDNLLTLPISPCGPHDGTS